LRSLRQRLTGSRGVAASSVMQSLYLPYRVQQNVRAPLTRAAGFVLDNRRKREGC